MKPIALYCADLHFKDKKPRCFEGDWYEFQKEIMIWLNEQCSKYNVDLYCVGDIFDKLKMSNHIVNLAIDNMPTCKTTVGNHDISYVHNLELIHKSAYGSFIRSSTAEQIENGHTVGDFNVVPFNFSEKFKECSGNKSIALIHELIWIDEPFIGAPKRGNVFNIVDKLKGYEIIIAGDNHSWFETEVDGIKILNCGSIMRLTASQKDYQPMVHLMYEDGSFEHIPVPTRELNTAIMDMEKDTKNKINAFANNISCSSVDDIDFAERVRQTAKLNKVDDKIMGLIESYLN